MIISRDEQPMITMRKVILLISLLGVIFSNVARAETRIVLAAVAAVSDDYVTFADLGTIVGDSAAIIKKQFLAPLAQKSARVFTRNDIYSRLQILGLERGVVILGSENIRIERDYSLAAQNYQHAVAEVPAEKTRAESAPVKTNVVKNAEKPERAITQISPAVPEKRDNRRSENSVDPRAEKSLRDLLNKIIATEFTGVDFRSQINIRRVVLSRKDYAALEISGVRDGRVPGRITVNLTAYDNDGNIADYGMAEANVEVELATFVLARSLNKGDIISDHDITVQYEKYSGARPEKLTMEVLRGRECQKPLRAGIRVAMADFIAPEVVKKGDELIVRGGDEWFTIEERVIALTGGRVGDFIMVQSAFAGNNKGATYRVRLTERGKAELAK